MAIKDLLEVSTIKTVHVLTSTNVRGKDIVVMIGTFSVVRDSQGRYMSFEKKLDIDVDEYCIIKHLLIIDTTEVSVEI